MKTKFIRSAFHLLCIVTILLALSCGAFMAMQETTAPVPAAPAMESLDRSVPAFEAGAMPTISEDSAQLEVVPRRTWISPALATIQGEIMNGSARAFLFTMVVTGLIGVVLATSFFTMRSRRVDLAGTVSGSGMGKPSKYLEASPA